MQRDGLAEIDGNRGVVFFSRDGTEAGRSAEAAPHENGRSLEETGEGRGRSGHERSGRKRKGKGCEHEHTMAQRGKIDQRGNGGGGGGV